jgi:hypothetical protein
MLFLAQPQALLHRFSTCRSSNQVQHQQTHRQHSATRALLELNVVLVVVFVLVKSL